MDSQETPINRQERRRRRSSLAAERVSLWFDEWVVIRGGDFLRAALDLARRPFQWIAWNFRRGLLWPMQDRIGGVRAALAGLAAILLLAGGAFAVLSANSGSNEPAEPVAAELAVSAARPPLAEAPKSAPRESGQTLQGATPVFEPAPRKAETAEVDPAQPLPSSPVSSDPATATIGAKPGATTSSSAPSPSATQSAVGIDGPPAGAKAIAVAKDFADAFVLYETGGEESKVRKAFAATATPELAKSLLQRPPRLPANVEVPEAKVVNVVAGPSHGGVYSVSVSLLRVGLTSELRLDMEKLKRDWRVTNVLG